MRKRLSDSNMFPALNVREECQKIDYLFSVKNTIGKIALYRLNPSYTIQQLFNDVFFNAWYLRGTFISLNEMRSKLNVTSDDLKSIKFDDESALDYLQFIINCVIYLKMKISSLENYYIAEDGLLDVILNNSKALVQKLGCKLTYYNEGTYEIFIQYNSEMLDSIAESHPEIARSLNEYRLHDNKGDLQRKGEVLCTLFKKLESVESAVKGTEFQCLFSDATFLFNKTGVRHWVEKDKTASRTFLKMSVSELEKWYDKTLVTFISCLAASDYLPVKQEIKEIKKLAEEEKNIETPI